MAPDSTPVSGGSSKVSVYATDEVVILSPDTTLQTVAERLVANQVGIVVLGSRAAVAGVVSERDVVRAVAAGLDLASTPAGGAGSRELVWCDADASVQEATELMMEQYLRHLLLERAGHLVGIVSARDLLGAYAIAGADEDV